MPAIGAPVLAKRPVEATGCVPPPGSGDVVAPATSLGLVVGVVVALSEGVGNGESVGVEVGVGVSDRDGD